MMQEALFLRLRDGPPLTRVDALAPDGKRVTLSCVERSVFLHTNDTGTPPEAVFRTSLSSHDPDWMRLFANVYYVGCYVFWKRLNTRLAGYRLAPPPCPKRKENSRT